MKKKRMILIAAAAAVCAAIIPAAATVAWFTAQAVPVEIPTGSVVYAADGSEYGRLERFSAAADSSE